MVKNKKQPKDKKKKGNFKKNDVNLKHLFSKPFTSTKSKPLKGSEQKKMVKKIIAQYGRALVKGIQIQEEIEKIEKKIENNEEYDKEAIKEELTPIEEQLEEHSVAIKAFFKSIKLVKHTLSNECYVYASQESQKPYFFTLPQDEEKVIPTLYLIWEYNLNLIGRPLTVPSEVTKFMLGGADLMLPGLNMMLYYQKKYRIAEPMIKNDKIHSVNIFSNEKAIFAIGKSQVSQKAAEFSDMKGKAIEVIHQVDDHLYQFYEDYATYTKPIGITKEQIYPLKVNKVEEEDDEEEEEEEIDQKENDNIGKEEMDNRLHEAFFLALATLDDEAIPCECSVVYNRMRKFDERCDIKQSSYKKLNDFMNHEAKTENVCKVKTLKKGGPLMLIAITKSHPLLKEATKKVNDIQEKVDKQYKLQEKKEKREHMIKLQHLYKIPSKLSYVIEQGKQEYYTSKELDSVLKSYIQPYFKKGMVTNAPADFLFELKQAYRQLSKRHKKSSRVIAHQGFDENALSSYQVNMIKALDGKEEAYFNQLPFKITKMLFEASLKHHYRLIQGSQNGPIIRGQAPPIHCHVAKVNNRIQTAVHNLPVYGIPVSHSQFQSWITSKMGVSAKFDNEGPHSADVVFQGDQSSMLPKLLEAEYGVPSNAFVIHSKLKRRRRH